MGKMRHDAGMIQMVVHVQKIGFGKHGIPLMCVIDRVTVFGNQLSLSSDGGKKKLNLHDIELQ